MPQKYAGRARAAKEEGKEKEEKSSATRTCVSNKTFAGYKLPLPFLYLQPFISFTVKKKNWKAKKKEKTQHSIVSVKP